MSEKNVSNTLLDEQKLIFNINLPPALTAESVYPGEDDSTPVNDDD